MVGSIDPRCEILRGTHWPVEVARLFGTRVAENHLGQRSTDRINRPDIWMQAIRSDPEKTLVARGPSTYGSRLCGAASKRRCTASGTRGMHGDALTPSTAGVIFQPNAAAQPARRAQEKRHDGHDPAASPVFFWGSFGR